MSFDFFLKIFLKILLFGYTDTDATLSFVKFTQNLVLFGTEIDIKTDTVFDLAILQAKQFIYKCKLDKCLSTRYLQA